MPVAGDTVMFEPAIMRSTPVLVTTTSPVVDGIDIPAPAATEATACVVPAILTVILPLASELAITPAPVKFILDKSVVMLALLYLAIIPADTVGTTH